MSMMLSDNSCVLFLVASCTKVLLIGELMHLQKMATRAPSQAPLRRKQLALCDHYTQQTALYHTEVFLVSTYARSGTSL